MMRAIALGALVVGLSQDAKLPVLEFTLTPDRESAALGEQVQLEAVLKNVSDKPLEVAGLFPDERSVSFSIEVQTAAGKSKTFEYSILNGDPFAAAPPPLEKLTLQPGKSFVAAFRIPVVLIGPTKITGRYRGGGDEAQAKPVNVTATPNEGKTKLAAMATFEAEEKPKTVMIDLMPEAAPAGVTNFVALAKRGFYKDLKVVEVVRSNWIRTGCPNNDGFGDAGYIYKSEHDMQRQENPSFVFETGTVALNQVQKMGYQSSQFFIALRRIQFLDFKFTIVGKVDLEWGTEKGQAVLNEIASKADPDRDTNRPKKDILLRKVEILTR